MNYDIFKIRTLKYLLVMLSVHVINEEERNNKHLAKFFTPYIIETLLFGSVFLLLCKLAMQTANGI